ncbi:WXG100 family type VII secretion target [Paucisalibacillus globulus]|jgi:WXG100 family type VII secretion target|uniref:WXG100 family type VII secretion target n=1 Tax=Paucisalibacillus globulus TaxID=351095 RepID=UPI00040462B5|nr:WXG100 family type VII secretion target [Paucisalibacillus globulus]
MSNIRLNPDELEGYAANYSRKAEDINGTIVELTQLTTNLGDLWEGEAFQAFFDQFEELKPSFLSMVELLQKIDQQLVSTAGALRDADTNVAGQIRA